jgi:hypothetical protein
MRTYERPTLTPAGSFKKLTDTAEERTLRKLASARHALASLIQRARIITASWDGASVPEAAQRLGCHPRTVYKWLHRFNAHGLDVLAQAAQTEGIRVGRSQVRRSSPAASRPHPAGPPTATGSRPAGLRPRAGEDLGLRRAARRRRAGGDPDRTLPQLSRLPAVAGRGRDGQPRRRHRGDHRQPVQPHQRQHPHLAVGAQLRLGAPAYQVRLVDGHRRWLGQRSGRRRIRWVEHRAHDDRSSAPGTALLGLGGHARYRSGKRIACCGPGKRRALAGACLLGLGDGA